MIRKHEMPFGAEWTEDRAARFRLWAPKATSVSLRLTDSPGRDVLMAPVGEGWFEIAAAKARVGVRYQFIIDDRYPVPDPASRFQPAGVHGPSELINPVAFDWSDAEWRGRPWTEAVLYELHIGAFAPEGIYAAAEAKLDYLVELGITAIELMPLSSFPGKRNWGYDGVLPFAPTQNYGRPEDLKHFIDTAHGKGLMILLDVVYNHFGPEGNYLHLYAPQFFTDRHHTPWGQAINFDGPESRTVRDFFIHNALYWLEEYHFDGLRLDAVHAILDDSRPDILTALAETVRLKFGGVRQVHLILENDDNAAHYLVRNTAGNPRLYTAQWNDDIHHALQVLLTGESDGYYGDCARSPANHLGRCLAEGFSYQGEASPYRNRELRGEPSGDLPPASFISFLQNHDQIGNRAMGERISMLADPAAVRTALTVLLLSPSPPLLFMGEEFAAGTPFLFFCDFGADLAAKVTAGRRSEFARFDRFNSLEVQALIPDPNCEDTFRHSKLDWASVRSSPHQEHHQFCRELLTCRHNEIVPRLKDIVNGAARYEVWDECAVYVSWPFSQGGALELLANFSLSQIAVRTAAEGLVLYSTTDRDVRQTLPPLSATWLLRG